MIYSNLFKFQFQQSYSVKGTINEEQYVPHGIRGNVKNWNQCLLLLKHSIDIKLYRLPGFRTSRAFEQPASWQYRRKQPAPFHCSMLSYTSNLYWMPLSSCSSCGIPGNLQGQQSCDIRADCFHFLKASLQACQVRQKVSPFDWCCSY